ncbi:hypothetical protein [Stenotrophomonas maltophilia]|uniref:hypothetical protein n=1 Tax=Stenotrophomonas maltophilia TaxID=40324 RepID=UPI00117D449D|nr:hypothetical protein [Stenotrophomonas maltophilia]
MLLNAYTRKKDTELLQESWEKYENVTIDPNALLRVESKYLDVPVEDEAQVIGMGADYDNDLQTFVVPPTLDLQIFKKWFPEVEDDLVSKDNTRSYLTKENLPLESFRLLKDSVHGIKSLALPLIFLGLTFLSALTSFFLSFAQSGKSGALIACLAIIPFLLTIPYLITIEQSFYRGKAEAAKSFFLLYLIPLIAGTMINHGQGLVAVALLTCCVSVWFFFYSIVFNMFFKSGVSKGEKRLERGLQVLSIVFVTSLVAAFLGPSGSGAVFACAATYALYYSNRQAKLRGIELVDYSSTHNMSKVGSLKDALQEQRRRQAMASVEDFSLRLEIGTSQGVIADKSHILAAAKNSIIRLTDEDSTRGTILFGNTGSGKTVLLVKIIYQVIANNLFFNMMHKKSESDEQLNQQDNTQEKGGV